MAKEPDGHVADPCRLTHFGVERAAKPIGVTDEVAAAGRDQHALPPRTLIDQRILSISPLRTPLSKKRLRFPIDFAAAGQVSDGDRALGCEILEMNEKTVARRGDPAKPVHKQKGMWNDKRLLSESWIRLATAAQTSNGTNANSDWNQGYGFQFWRCRHNAYRGDGAFGQFCVVMPEQDVVLAITAGQATCRRR